MGNVTPRPKVRRREHPITCYADPELVRRLDQYAAAAGLDRSAAVRVILLAALSKAEAPA